MTKLKNWKCDKTQNSKCDKTQIVTKLEKKTHKVTKLKTQNMTKLKEKSKCEQTQKSNVTKLNYWKYANSQQLKIWQNSKTQNVTKLKNTKCWQEFFVNNNSTPWLQMTCFRGSLLQSCDAFLLTFTHIYYLVLFLHFFH